MENSVEQPVFNFLSHRVDVTFAGREEKANHSRRHDPSLYLKYRARESRASALSGCISLETYVEANLREGHRLSIRISPESKAIQVYTQNIHVCVCCFCLYKSRTLGPLIDDLNLLANAINEKNPAANNPVGLLFHYIRKFPSC